MAPNNDEITWDPYGKRVHTKIRRAVVVRDMPSHCICVPINTYSWQGEDRHVLRPQDQYKLFPAKGNWDNSRVDMKQLPLVVENSDAELDYELASVDFTRIFYVPHYALVKKIGRIDKLGLPLLEECLRKALGVPLATEEAGVGSFNSVNKSLATRTILSFQLTIYILASNSIYVLASAAPNSHS
jgi:hypothetical protein